MLVRDFGLSAILFPVDPFSVPVFRPSHCSKDIHLLKLTCALYAGRFSSPSPRREARNATGPRDGSGARGNGSFASSTLTTTNIIAYLARADNRHSRQHFHFLQNAIFELPLLVQHSDIQTNYFVLPFICLRTFLVKAKPMRMRHSKRPWRARSE
jgi:hypothetical protein